MNSGEAVDVRKPKTEELVCAAIHLEDRKCELGIVIYGVDDNLNQVYPIGFDLELVVCNGAHGYADKLSNMLVDMASKAQHERLCQFATANSVDAADFLVLEYVPCNLHDRIDVGRVLHHVISAELNEVF